MPDDEPAMAHDDTITWAAAVVATAETIGDHRAARWLCEHASGAADAAEFDAMRDELVTARAGLHLEAMVGRLLAGEPLQYVMGRWAFRRLDVMVDPRVLIPRPDTETLVEVALAELGALRARGVDHATVVDLGTGSGAVGLALLDESPLGAVTVWMTDASPDALDVARANAAGLGRRGGGARFALGSWFDALSGDLRGALHLVVANPPYIADGDHEVEESVTSWEPHDALFSGADGLDAIREIVAGAGEWLAPGAMLAVEIGHTQAAAVSDLCTAAGLREVAITRDPAGRDRVVSARR